MTLEFRPTASLATLRLRAALLAFVRRFFDAAGYLEVETPLLSPDVVVDAHIEPFSTRFRPDPARPEGTELFLQTSPEFSLKRLLASGCGPVFEVFRAFRDGEAGRRHNPEFTLIEWYRPGDTHVKQMTFTETFVRAFQREAMRLSEPPPRSPSPSGEGLGVKGLGTAAASLAPRPSSLAASRIPEAASGRTDAKTKIGTASQPLTPGPSPQGEGSNGGFEQPFDRFSYDEAFERFAGVRVLKLGAPALADLARSHGIPLPPGLTATDSDRDDWLNLLLAELVEPHLGTDRPAFLYDYPASQSALARVRDGDPPVAERFELYVGGVELCNGYHELLDADELRRRNRVQNALRTAAGRRPLPEDSRLLAAMDAGLPPCSGVALGFDRLLMTTLGKRSVGEVRAFLTETGEIS